MDPFEVWASAARDEVGEMIARLPAEVEEVSQKVGALTEVGLADVEAKFLASTDPGSPETNKTVVGLVSYAREAMARCVRELRAIERYISLHVPAAEDGNNFGVAVQLETVKVVGERRAKIKELLDKFVEYHKDRAGLWKEVAVKSSTEELSSRSSSSEAEGGKTTDKNTTKTQSETKKTAPTPLPDALASIAALDAHWYFQVVFALEAVRDAKIACIAAVTKNRAKLERPKGEGAGGMNMF